MRTAPKDPPRGDTQAPIAIAQTSIASPIAIKGRSAEWRRGNLIVIANNWLHARFEILLAGALLFIAAKMIAGTVLIYLTPLPDSPAFDLHARINELTREAQAAYRQTHQEPCAFALLNYPQCETGITEETRQDILRQAQNEMGATLEPFGSAIDARMTATVWTAILAPLLYLLASFILPFHIGGVMRGLAFGLPAFGCAVGALFFCWGGGGVPLTGGLVIAALVLARVATAVANIPNLREATEPVTTVAHTRSAKPHHVFAHGITSAKRWG